MLNKGGPASSAHGQCFRRRKHNVSEKTRCCAFSVRPRVHASSLLASHQRLAAARALHPAACAQLSVFILHTRITRNRVYGYVLATLSALKRQTQPRDLALYSGLVLLRFLRSSTTFSAAATDAPQDITEQRTRHPASATCAKDTRSFPAPGGDGFYAARTGAVRPRVRSLEQASADITRGSSCYGEGDAAASGGIFLRELCEDAARVAAESTSRGRGRARWGRGRVELGICASSDGCAPHSTPDDR
ncbi:hypothetical protein C8J57DRAFT_1237142 [Mycena rebaudengoi]|nr:hypothetical protein C8J57DRAFT_1237142 [Mycena rebaudengoi]